MINVFEYAGYRTLAEIVRNTVILCEDESEVDDSSDYDEPISQPDTYPNVNLNPFSASPKQTNHISQCDEYLLIDPDTAEGLPKGENCIIY